VLGHLLLCDFGLHLRHYEDAQGLAPHWVWYADYRRLRHGWMGCRYVLHLPGGQLVAGDFNHVV